MYNKESISQVPSDITCIFDFILFYNNDLEHIRINVSHLASQRHLI